MREPDALRFGRYEVLFRIAAGGMAEVYAARMVGEGGFEKPVALKRMLPTLAEDERFVQMFLDEGRLAAHISSPHVVQTLDLGRAEDDSLYLVMELVVGVSLSALIRAVLKKRTPFPVPVAVDLLAQAASGLHDAHEARTMYGQPLEIVHRDVSPQNILVDVSGRVRITDFGVARALERATHTQSGEVKGKIGYFAPEQVRGKEIDRRTDVFALGIVAWETFAGRRLFSGDNPAQTLDMVMSMDIPRLDALRSDVPAPLADAVARALSRDLAHRTPSAGDMAEELRYALVAAGMRPSGSSAVGALVREHGGESLMKLEDGLRAQSPSALSRVRRSTGGAELANGAPVAAPIAIEVETAAAPLPAPAPLPQPSYLATASAETHFMPGREPRGASPIAWVVGAGATISFLVAMGVGGYLLANRDVPEPRSIALPPVPTATTITIPPPVTAPAAPPVTAVADPVAAPADEVGSEGQAGTQAEAAHDTTTSAAHPRGGHGGRPATRPTTPPSTTTTAARPEEPATSMSTTPVASSMSTEPTEPAATTMRSPGMSTGLVGVSDFERELGLE